MRVLRTIVLLKLLLTLIVSPVVAGTVPLYSVVAGNSGDDLEAFIDQTIAAQMEKSGITGAAVSIVVSGQVVLSKGYGYANRDEDVTVDPDSTTFRVGSISKLFTWTAVMQLVKQGKLNLDADVNEYLDFAIPTRLVNSRAEVGPITMRHLMTHTPGFEDISDGLFFLSADKMLPLGDYVRTYLPARVFAPGEAMAYSNYGTTLAGYIVEQVSGMAYETYVNQNILAPLAMNQSTFRQPLPEAMALDMAIGYNRVNNEYLEGSFVFVQPAPAGALSTTATDMAAFMLAHLQGGSLNGIRVITPESARQMHTQSFTHHSSLSGMTLGFIEASINGQQVLYHGGSLPLFYSGVYLLPKNNTGFFVSFSGGGDFLATAELFQSFMDQYSPHTVAQLTPPQGSRERAKHLIGEYHLNRRSFTTDESLLSLIQSMGITVDNEGYLLATFMGETSRFVEVEPGVYQSLREGRSPVPYGEFRTLVFIRDYSGRIMLASDGPMTYSKAPWYGSLPFTILALVGSILVMLGSLLYWVISEVVSTIRRTKRATQQVVVMARVSAIALSVTALITVVGIVGSAEMSPIYGVPLSFFGILPAWTSLLGLLQGFLIPLTLVTTVLAVISWLQGYWRLAVRVHYTVFALSALLLMWVLRYWNLV